MVWIVLENSKECANTKTTAQTILFSFHGHGQCIERPFSNVLWKAYTNVISFQLKNASQALFSSLVRYPHSTTGTAVNLSMSAYERIYFTYVIPLHVMCCHFSLFLLVFCFHNWFEIREKSSDSFVRWRGGGVDSTLVNMQLFLNDIDKLFGNWN